MNPIPLPAFQDKDLLVLHDGRRAPVADPGDAQPGLACLQRDRLQPGSILVTHHAAIAGLAELPDPTGASARGDDACRTRRHMVANPKFASRLEPGNAKLINERERCKERRARGLPTTWSATMERELEPLLRTRRGAGRPRTMLPPAGRCGSFRHLEAMEERIQ